MRKNLLLKNAHKMMLICCHMTSGNKIKIYQVQKDVVGPKRKAPW